MAQKSTDLQSEMPQGVPDEFRIGAGWVLAAVAHRYRTENPERPVDLLGFPIAVGATASRLIGASHHGGMPKVARIAHRAAPAITEGMPRGEVAGLLVEAARSLGFEWSEDDSEPAIPKLPIPGPRRAPEKHGTPVPRREQRAQGARR